MPIRKSERGRYPKDWDAIRARTMARADGQCECRGLCGEHGVRCEERDGAPARHFQGFVHLAPAHLNHVPEDCRPENLLALCQRCHFMYDRWHHSETRRQTMDRKAWGGEWK